LSYIATKTCWPFLGVARFALAGFAAVAAFAVFRAGALARAAFAVAALPAFVAVFLAAMMRSSPLRGVAAVTPANLAVPHRVVMGAAAGKA